MQIKNTETRYGLVAKFFHWSIALLIISMLCLGLYMTDLPLNAEKLRLYGWHKEFGVVVLMLAIARFTWRMRNITPVLPATLPLWQKFGAHFVHYILYGFMFAMPLTGWLMSSASGVPVSFFGLFTLPDFVAPNHDLKKLLETLHEWLAYGLIATLVGHVGAGLHHHFILKNDILRRMLPW